jgi:hypothetical protein
LLDVIVALLASAEKVIVMVAELLPGPVDAVPACAGKAMTNAASAALSKSFCRMCVFPSALGHYGRGRLSSVSPRRGMR